MSDALTLQHLKRNPAKRERFARKTVLIWSGEHEAWWRPSACGYTDEIAKAGRFAFEDAWARSSHCSAEKRIRYEVDVAAKELPR